MTILTNKDIDIDREDVEIYHIIKVGNMYLGEDSVIISKDEVKFVLYKSKTRAKRFYTRKDSDYVHLEEFINEIKSLIDYDSIISVIEVKKKEIVTESLVDLTGRTSGEFKNNEDYIKSLLEEIGKGINSSSKLLHGGMTEVHKEINESFNYYPKEEDKDE